MELTVRPGPAVTSTSRDNTTLLGVPPVIRARIYDYLKADYSSQVGSCIRIADGVRVSHPLSRTCRELRAECVTAFVDSDRVDNIEAIVVDFRFDSLSPLMNSFLPRTGLPARSLHIILQFTGPGKTDTHALRAWFNNCQTLEKHGWDRTYRAVFDWDRYSIVWADALYEEVGGGDLPGKQDWYEIRTALHAATLAKRRGIDIAVVEQWLCRRTAWLAGEEEEEQA